MIHVWFVASGDDEIAAETLIDNLTSLKTLIKIDHWSFEYFLHIQVFYTFYHVSHTFFI